MHRKFWLPLLGLALASCTDSSSSDGTVPAKHLIKAFEAGSIWCTAYDEPSKSCTSIHTATRFTRDGVIVKVVTAEPHYIKTEYQTELSQKDNRLCREDPEGRVLATLNSYQTSNASADITGDDRSLKFSTSAQERELFEAFRDTLIKDQSLLDKRETCWAYQKTNSTQKGLEQELTMVTYVNDVRQHYIPAMNRGRFFPAETKLTLRSETQ